MRIDKYAALLLNSFGYIKPSLGGSWLPVFLGVIAFFLITGGRVLDPSYTDWLLDGDPATHWLGWQFFRHSDFLQWPLGANPNYGMRMSSSIVFTDSIPLLAFIFKPFSALLPENFQYFGIWILLSFSFQAFFSWKLLSLFNTDKRLLVLGTLFFLFAPVYLWRLPMHFALFGHWLLLAGLYFYFTKKFSIYRWFALLVVAVLVHAYLFVMLIAIWLVDLMQRYILKQLTVVDTVKYFLLISVAVVFIMWAAGYFMMGSSVSASHFGDYRMNLLAMIDPDVLWSQILPNQKGINAEAEGFNYLGIGMIGLTIVAIPLLALDRATVIKYIPIIILVICLTLFSISDHVAFGLNELFIYELPETLNKIAAIFRNSGRFFWPVYYLIYLLVFYAIFSVLKAPAAIFLCLSLLAVQIIDSFNGLNAFREKTNQTLGWVSPMKSLVWRDLANNYKKVIYVLPRHKPDNWIVLSRFASINKMSINVGYFARKNPEKLQQAQSEIKESIIQNNLNGDSLYIFDDNLLWEQAVSQLAPNDVAGILDGFRILAPNLAKCSYCRREFFTDIYN